jgi:hypothetical protein
MYAEIPEKNVQQFMNVIEEGKIYDIRKFFMFPKKYVFHPVNAQAMIKFTKYTSIVERLGLESLFPFCTYELTPFPQLPGLQICLTVSQVDPLINIIGILFFAY